MFHHRPLQVIFGFATILLTVAALPPAAVAQYPMLMGLKPVAAQVGQTSEHTISSRYNLYGAHKVLVTGRGVTAEIVPVAKPKDGKTPNLTTLKLKFTIAPDAQPGVRDFRLATPRGASTVGQIVIVRDKVVSETGNNDSAAKAQAITLPATICALLPSGRRKSTIVGVSLICGPVAV